MGGPALLEKATAIGRQQPRRSEAAAAQPNFLRAVDKAWAACKRGCSVPWARQLTV